jgi:quinoprotein glucose dehydrogenase
MSTDGAFSRPRLLPSLLGLVLIVMGLIMVGLGIKLATLGGSLYYLIAGIAIVVTGVLLLRGSSKALGLYAVVLFASTLWSLWEIGLDWWQLVPRLSLWFVVGLLLLLPWFRRPLVRRQPAGRATLGLGAAVVLAGACALASQFTRPGEIAGELDRDSAGTSSAAPTQPDGEWQAWSATRH